MREVRDSDAATVQVSHPPAEDLPNAGRIVEIPAAPAILGQSGGAFMEGFRWVWRVYD
jgi:hypothetical protein